MHIALKNGNPSKFWHKAKDRYHRTCGTDSFVINKSYLFINFTECLSIKNAHFSCYNDTCVSSCPNTTKPIMNRCVPLINKTVESSVYQERYRRFDAFLHSFREFFETVFHYRTIIDLIEGKYVQKENIIILFTLSNKLYLRFFENNFRYIILTAVILNLIASHALLLLLNWYSYSIFVASVMGTIIIGTINS